MCDELMRNFACAGHHPQDENITNTTTQFFADDWPKWNETTNSTWIDDEDFRWNSPYDYVGAQPLEVYHHHLIDVSTVTLAPPSSLSHSSTCTPIATLGRKLQ